LWRGLSTTYGPERKKWYQLVNQKLPKATKHCPYCDVVLETPKALRTTEFVLWSIWMIYVVFSDRVAIALVGPGKWEQFETDIGMITILLAISIAVRASIGYQRVENV
jgi:hypothetical protein